MDRLSQVLDNLRLKSFVHSRNEFTAPWGVRIPGAAEAIPEDVRLPAALSAEVGAAATHRGRAPAPVASFFAITRGGGWVAVDGGDGPVQFGAGDLLVLPRGRAHQLRDSLQTRVRPVWEAVSRDNFEAHGGVRHGGGGAATCFIFGGFLADDRDHSRFLSALPPLIHVRAGDAGAAPWLGEVVRVLAYETETYGPGAQTIINHLAHVVFVQAVRVHVAALPAGAANGNWLGALLDPEIGPALGEIHSRPDAPWTVASLADIVAMSRSAFAARFAALVGEPPLQYLTHYRMRRAADLLRTGRTAVKEIAAKAGYESEAAFSNAFKRHHGASPATYRARHSGRRVS